LAGGDFTFEPLPWGFNDIMSARALAVTSAGAVRVAYRNWPTWCPTATQLYTEEAGTADTGPAAVPSSFALGAPAPNPWRGAEPLRVSLAVPRETQVAIELHDLAGRRVARRSAERLRAGTHALAWNPGPLAPGLYWLSLRVPEGRVAGRVLIVTR
jgi:hypothetical protein